MAEIVTTLKFLQWQELYKREKPFLCFVDIPQDADDKRDNNLVFEDRETRITDIRPSKEQFTLDGNGFMMRPHSSTLPRFDTEGINTIYLAEVEDLLQQSIDGVDEVFIFDWRLRRNEPETWGEVIDLNDNATWLRPLSHAHNDQSASAVVGRIRSQLPQKAERLLKGRVRVVNVWRPINHAVQDCPLAFCDGSTVDSADLIETDHIRRHYTGSNLYAMFNPKTHWHYLSNQTPDEVVFMKMFDSNHKVQASCCPHASFEIPGIAGRKDILPRESIEVRAMVFTYA